MKTSRKVLFFISLILVSCVLAGICTCVYLFNWREEIFWWSLVGGAWIIDIILAVILFNNKYLPDETKMFWMLVLFLLPIYGALCVCFIGLRRKTQKENVSDNHAILLQAIFSAKKKIRIYSDSFFVSYDTFQALNFAVFKGIDIEIIVGKQRTKHRQKLLKQNFQRYLEDPIKILLANQRLSNSFLIVDDKKALIADINFNFRRIFSKYQIKEIDDISLCLETYKNGLKDVQPFSLKNKKITMFFKFKNSLGNLFYLFY